jgi:7-cyano-7-deazaguanine synthase
MKQPLIKTSPDIDAVVLLSGGMDSTTLLYYVKRQYTGVVAVSFNYNQRHYKELQSARNICKFLLVPHKIIKLDFPRFVGSPLVDPHTAVPEQKKNQQKITVVPFRNSVFLIYACLYAKTVNAKNIYIGAVAEDQRSYPDCRPEFFQSFQEMIYKQEEVELKIHYPFITKTKKDLILLGKELQVPWEKTWSCYKGEKKPCMVCDACMERKDAFQEAGINDPLSRDHIDTHERN